MADGPKAGTPLGGLGGAAPPADQGGLVAKSRSPRGGVAMPAVALPMARPAQQGGASGSGGTAVDGPNRPAPSVGSQFYMGGTVESELGQLLAFFASDRLMRGNANKGQHKRCKVKGSVGIVGKKAPTVQEANAAMADPSQQEAMRIKIHNWLTIVFSQLVERQVVVHPARKKVMLDLLS